MHHLRYNIAGALGAILFVAVGFTALREADELWDSWLFSLTLGFLLLAVLLAAHRKGDRRGFWIGFALFGWGYLSLSLIPSTEPRLITAKALSYLHQSKIFGIRLYRIRVILDLDRLRAYNVSRDDIPRALMETRVLGSPEEELRQALGQTWRTLEDRPDSYVLGHSTRHNKPEYYENIILKASSEGEILRLRDVAKVEIGSSFYAPRVGSEADPDFIHIGHTLFAWLAAWLGGVLSRRLRIIFGNA